MKTDSPTNPSVATRLPRTPRPPPEVGRSSGDITIRVTPRVSPRDIEARYEIVIPNFVGGLGSVLDLAASGFVTIYEGPDPWGQDAAALSNDWTIVGHDLRVAANRSRR